VSSTFLATRDPDGNRAEGPGQKLKRARERLGLKFRDVEIASQTIARRHSNDEFAIALSRLADIENKGTVPSLYRLYSLCSIYRLDLDDVLDWYGVRRAEMPGDAASVQHPATHLVNFRPAGSGEIQVPLALDPGMDISKTTYLSRMIQRWGKLPLMLMDRLDVRNRRYAFIGAEDWSMHPLLAPGSLVMIDESRKKILSTGWSTEFDRPIYFLEHRTSYLCGWCSLEDNTLTVFGHPSQSKGPSAFAYPSQIDVIGQVTAVAMRFDLSRRRRTRS